MLERRMGGGCLEQDVSGEREARKSALLEEVDVLLLTHNTRSGNTSYVRVTSMTRTYTAHTTRKTQHMFQK
jgi:hypothetical protein